MYRMRDLADAGASISFGSDWPVSSPDPLQGIATAVNRSTPGGKSWTKQQALSIREALTAYTSGVSSQLSISDNFGTLQDGQHAEFVVLSANPFETSDQQLFDLKVLGTSTRANPLTKTN
jgi:predicted amidohydrolase YtcJ